MQGQIGLVLDNLEAALTTAGLGFGNLVKLTVHATDVDAALRNLDLPGQPFGPVVWAGRGAAADDAAGG